jgi:hypothetical protein
VQSLNVQLYVFMVWPLHGPHTFVAGLAGVVWRPVVAGRTFCSAPVQDMFVNRVNVGSNSLSLQDICAELMVHLVSPQ